MCYYYCAIIIGKQEGVPPSVPECQGISLWLLLSEYSSFDMESPALRGRSAWDHARSNACHGGCGAGAGLGWGGRQLQGLRGCLASDWVAGGCQGTGGDGAEGNTESSLPVPGGATAAQTSWEMERWGQAFMKCPSEAGQRHPEKAGLWEGGCWGQKPRL